jgi:uncharacterized protein YndB with AHSA1/START domain
MDTNTTTFALNITRHINAPREQVYAAWTDPEQLQQWWRIDASWSTPIAEVDLREGGKYRLGMQAPDKEAPHVAIGIFKEVKAPEKLVFTWNWEGGQGPDTLVTVEFSEIEGATEILLKHEKFVESKVKDEHNQGWIGCLQQLEKLF